MYKCNAMILLTVRLLLTLQFCFENCFIKCCLILSFETLTLLYFASRIRPQSCMLHLLKVKFSFRGRGEWGRGWGTRSPLSDFSGSTPAETHSSVQLWCELCLYILSKCSAVMYRAIHSHAGNTVVRVGHQTICNQIFKLPDLFYVMIGHHNWAPRWRSF